MARKRKTLDDANDLPGLAAVIEHAKTAPPLTAEETARLDAAVRGTSPTTSAELAYWHGRGPAPVTTDAEAREALAAELLRPIAKKAPR